MQMQPDLEVSRQDVSDLDLATDAPGFGLDVESSVAPEPTEEPTPEPEAPPADRDEKGRFVKKDGEPEAAAEPEADPEAPAEPEPEPKRDSPEELARKKIPYTRFKEAVEKEREKVRALEERLRAAEERLQKPDTVDVDDTELTRLGDMLIEGKTAEYAAGLKNIIANAVQTGVKLATERAVAQTQMEAVQHTAEQERAQAAQRWAVEYPVFDPKSEQFDESLTREAVLLRNAYESEGFSPSEALSRAVTVVTNMYGIAKVPAEEAPAPAPRKPEPEVRRKQVQDKMAMAQAQPPRAATGEVDQPETLIERVSRMTPEEFDKLSEDDLERLRNGIYA